MERWKTREVKVGSVGVGSDNPIRIQSMTTSNTRDLQATVDQIIKLADSGCEIARVTVQGKREADACEGIKNELVKRGYTIPLVADIHFYPPAAMRVVDFADKVRINPGNFVDKRATFKVIEYDDDTYAEELEKLEEKFSPLVEKCKRLKRAMRIGTNHGSLSDRILNRFGDTPAGMVESAFEFTRVCRKLDFHDIIFSMKASNTRVMIEAYRLLVEEMKRLDWNYPIHLGVTEAGEGEDGRVKSSIGIGSLLLDGIGDTIRVSLTEDPWKEVDPCKRLVSFAKRYEKPAEKAIVKRSIEVNPPLHRDGSVVVTASQEEIEAETFYADIGCDGEMKVDVILVEDESHPKLEKVRAAEISVIKEPTSFILFAPEDCVIDRTRQFFKKKRPAQPVILKFSYDCAEEDLVIHASSEFGSLLCDGLGEGICIEANIPLAARRSLSFAILQGARMRQSKTEFISCPGCGRTLFDLQTVAEKIRKRTGHLAGVKIAIMGCIVNGPGEMADADFGYVGSTPGKIDLYVGKERVEKNIDMEEAEERLVELIKKHDRWTEPNLEPLEPILK